VKFLLDANVWLELILKRANHDDVARMLGAAPGRVFATTDFAINAVGIFTAKRQPSVFLSFLDDLIKNEVGLLHLPPSSLRDVVNVISAYRLDFDDAFQYIAAERFSLELVSLDADFDHTPRGRITPAQALQEIASAGATP
jgi:predicted nucleic acid-binding protein